MNATRPIRFFHRGRVVEADAGDPTRTVLQWLREDAHRTGTKEGCAEGDCGACTVVVGDLDEQGALALQTVNACIRFLPTLDGRALFTVEDVAGTTLHPVQQALVDGHGSQCGFCTPGFVMSLWACYERHQRAGTQPDRAALADELSGNLCRCTGYRPILDAGERMFAIAPPVLLDRAPVEAALRELSRDVSRGLAPVLHPRTIDELAAAFEAAPQSRLVAGSTDVGLWVTKQLRALGPVVFLGDVAELRRIEVTPAHIAIGAGASLEDAFAALAAEWPVLREMWLRFASPPVRHAGTMGGNVANGSPIGDSAPVLMALNATLVLRRGARVRRVALDAFYLGYMKNALEAGEFLQAIEVPRAAAAKAATVRAYKISKRYDSDISAVSAGLAVELSGTNVAASRLAFGGLAATVKRAAAAEAALAGRPWTEATLEAAAVALSHDFQPLADHRAGSAYRLQVAQNLLRRFWLETRPVDPLPPAAVNVREVAA